MTSEGPRSADVALSERHLYPSPADTRKCHQNVRSRKNLQVSDLSVLPCKEVYAYLRPAREKCKWIFSWYFWRNLQYSFSSDSLTCPRPVQPPTWYMNTLTRSKVISIRVTSFFWILQRVVGSGAHVPVLSWPQVDHRRNDFNHVALGPGTDHMGQVYSKAGRNSNILNSVVVSGW